MLALAGGFDFAKNVNLPPTLMGVGTTFIFSLFRGKGVKLIKFFLDESKEIETIEEYATIEKKYTEILKEIDISQDSFKVEGGIKFCSQPNMSGAPITDHSYRVPNKIQSNIFLKSRNEKDEKIDKEIAELYGKRILIFAYNKVYSNMYLNNKITEFRGINGIFITLFFKEILEPVEITKTFKKIDIVAPEDANTEEVKHNKTISAPSIDGTTALNNLKNCYAVMPPSFVGVFA